MLTDIGEGLLVICTLLVVGAAMMSPLAVGMWLRASGRIRASNVVWTLYGMVLVLSMAYYIGHGITT